MRIGAHQSIAGGLHCAYPLATEDGCEAIQVFTKNANQWRDPPVSPEQAAAFRDARAASPLADAPVLSHDSYLINLCALDDGLRERSRESLLHEALRCEALGIEHVVLHPGAHLGAGVEAAIAQTVEGLAWVLERTRGANVSLLVENTAGQGSVLGSRFEEVGAILRGVDEVEGDEAKRRIGVCLDTCHTFAAGYDIATPAGFDRVWAELEREVGIARIKAMHLNDSKKGLGCRLDRHERIGEGELGKYPFWRMQNDPALAGVVAVLETPPEEKDRAFRQQLEMMRGFVGAPAPVRAQKAFALEVMEAAPVKKGRGARVRR